MGGYFPSILNPARSRTVGRSRRQDHGCLLGTSVPVSRQPPATLYHIAAASLLFGMWSYSMPRRPGKGVTDALSVLECRLQPMLALQIKPQRVRGGEGGEEEEPFGNISSIFNGKHWTWNCILLGYFSTYYATWVRLEQTARAYKTYRMGDIFCHM